MACAYNSNIREVEVKRSGIQIQPRLQSDLKVSLEYMIPYVKKQKKNHFLFELLTIFKHICHKTSVEIFLARKMKTNRAVQLACAGFSHCKTAFVFSLELRLHCVHRWLTHSPQSTGDNTPSFTILLNKINIFLGQNVCGLVIQLSPELEAWIPN